MNYYSTSQSMFLGISHQIMHYPQHSYRSRLPEWELILPNLIPNPIYSTHPKIAFFIRQSHSFPLYIFLHIILFAYYVLFHFVLFDLCNFTFPWFLLLASARHLPLSCYETLSRFPFFLLCYFPKSYYLAPLTSQFCTHPFDSSESFTLRIPPKNYHVGSHPDFLWGFFHVLNYYQKVFSNVKCLKVIKSR